MMEKVIFDIKNLKVYSSGNEIVTFNFTVLEKEHVMIYSSDKSSEIFLKCLNRNSEPIDGEIYYYKDNILTYNLLDSNEYKITDCIYINPSLPLIDDLNVKDNLYLSLSINRLEEDKKYIKELLQIFSLNKLLDKMPSELTLYDTLRVKIARALFNKPFVLLIPDLSTLLDDDMLKKVYGLLNKINDIYKVTLITSTSSPDTLKYANKKIIIENNETTLI